MSVLGRACRRLIGRDRPAETNPRSAVLLAIAHTREQQAKLAADAGAVFVKRAEIERALTNQHLVLAGAAEQIRQAIAVAQNAAAGARADDGVDASPYELTAQGLQTQLDVVVASIAQLEQLRTGAQANVTSAQTMLRDNAASLDRALRAEVHLLGRLERLERQRVIAEAMRRRGRSGPANPADS
jgi:hypothetical protein